MTKNNDYGNLEFLAMISLVLCFFIIGFSQFGYGDSHNARNETVTTTVNITNAFPEILSVTITPSTLTLNAGSTAELTVNVSVRDFDGYNDISLVNVTFFDANNATASSQDDNNNHYSNSSCAFVNGNGTSANYTCAFNIQYYANNGTNWTANATVQDNDDFVDTLTNTSAIESLLALNVTNLIDFGNLAVGETSINTTEANVTNYGNVQINVSVYGYGSTLNDGLAMVCTTRNITIGFERFSTNETEPYATMTAMDELSQHIPGFQLPQRLNDSAGGEVVNGTYWRLQVPVSINPAGNCSGFVVFQAETP